MCRAEHMDMTWEEEYDAEVAAEKEAAGKALPDATLPSQLSAGSPPSLKGSEAPCSPHHAPPRSNWTSISARTASMFPCHRVAACCPPPPHGPCWGLGAGTACEPGAENPRGPGLKAPLRLQHLAAHCLGSEILAWALRATLAPQLAARTHGSAVCSEGLEYPVCADTATGRAEQLCSAPKDLPCPPSINVRAAPPPDSSLRRGKLPQRPAVPGCLHARKRAGFC